jgi:hypothetical protein
MALPDERIIRLTPELDETSFPMRKRRPELFCVMPAGTSGDQFGKNIPLAWPERDAITM